MKETKQTRTITEDECNENIIKEREKRKRRAHQEKKRDDKNKMD